MITQESINFIKKHVLITDYLASRGIQPHIEQRGQFLYFSPLRDERTPSFWVDPQKNLFNDFGNTKHGGDIIRLVQLLEKCDFVSAVKHLDIFYGQHGNCHFFLSCQKTSLSTNKTDSNEELRAVKPLSNQTLIAYLASRYISKATAYPYVQDVYFRNDDKNYFAIGFKNDKEGYALRAGCGIKRNLGPSHFTTLDKQGSTSVNVFEGFMDFLSALEYFHLTQPSYSTLVLNSTTNIHKALAYLEQFKQVNVFFDHDETGKKTLQYIVDHGLTIVDRSPIYSGSKDFNEHLTRTCSTNNRRLTRVDSG